MEWCTNLNSNNPRHQNSLISNQGTCRRLYNVDLIRIKQLILQVLYAVILMICQFEINCSNLQVDLLVVLPIMSLENSQKGKQDTSTEYSRNSFLMDLLVTLFWLSKNLSNL